MFLHLSDLTIDNCPKLVLPWLPSIRSLTVIRSSNELLRELWREFFNQPLEVKENYANSSTTYEGYGSRLGINKGATLD
ncbi:hypothetical protein RJT34_32101 [Clitoria ternatea]|uniref:Uncharacterized protein n=1 Tax=Clitoria ternatea TaxID=43366 RepID=A0AAN9EVS5_CLITE